MLLFYIDNNFFYHLPSLLSKGVSFDLEKKTLLLKEQIGRSLFLFFFFMLKPPLPKIEKREGDSPLLVLKKD